MSLLEQNARSILDRAIMSPVGIIIDLEAPVPMDQMARRARDVLYRFRKESPLYSCLSIRFDPDSPDTALWIIKGEQEFDPEVEPIEPVDI